MRFFYYAAFFLLLARGGYADSCTSAANLIKNCGFEGGDLTDWNVAGIHSGPAYRGISYGVDSQAAHSGQYGAYLGDVGAFLFLSQSFATVPDTTYVISYYLSQSPATVSPYISAFTTTLGSRILFSGGNAPELPFTQYRFTVTANAATSLLSFSARDDTGYFSLDDVSVVVAAPEPSSLAFVLAPLAFGLFVLLRNRAGRYQTSCH